MSISAAEYRRREQSQKDRRLLLWLLGSALAHGLGLLLLLLWFLFSPSAPLPDEPVEFTIVDPSDFAPTDAELQANNNSVDAGEADPTQDPNAGGGNPVEGTQTQAPPPQPPQPQPVQPAPQQQAAAPPPPPEPVAPPEPAPPEPDPIPQQAEVPQAPPVPAPTPLPTPVPTPRPTPPPISTPAPQTRESNVDQLAALPQPLPRQPAPTRPAPTRDSAASQLGGPVSSNSASGLTNPSQSGPGAPSVAANANLDWGPYLARLQQRVERRWIPGQSNTSRRSVVTFTVNRNGSVSNVRLASSSGNQQTDSAALTAIQQASPLEPLPAAFTGQSVDIHFTFDLNVAGGVFAR
ncbi:MAG: TonB family protein [Cyanobacteria bacterium P01_E01_bin.45]